MVTIVFTGKGRKWCAFFVVPFVEMSIIVGERDIIFSLSPSLETSVQLGRPMTAASAVFLLAFHWLQQTSFLCRRKQKLSRPQDGITVRG